MPDRKELAKAALLDLRIKLHYERTLQEYNLLFQALVQTYGEILPRDIAQVLRFVERRTPCVELLQDSPQLNRQEGYDKNTSCSRIRNERES